MHVAISTVIAGAWRCGHYIVVIGCLSPMQKDPPKFKERKQRAIHHTYNISWQDYTVQDDTELDTWQGFLYEVAGTKGRSQGYNTPALSLLPSRVSGLTPLINPLGTATPPGLSLTKPNQIVAGVTVLSLCTGAVCIVKNVETLT